MFSHIVILVHYTYSIQVYNMVIGDIILSVMADLVCSRNDVLPQCHLAVLDVNSVFEDDS